MDAAQIAQQRMAGLGLTGGPATDPVEVVRSLVAVQSQDYGPAKWSLAQRMAATAAATDAALDDAFSSGAFLRTHVLRPTWHFVLPEDLRWLLELTGPRVTVKNAHYLRREGLDEDVRKRSATVIEKALDDGQPRTRKQLGAALTEAGIDIAGIRGTLLLMQAEQEGLICSGPLQGKQHTHMLLDARVPPVPPRTRDDALAELTLRYFTSHGPATIKDFGWWSSLTVADIRRGLGAVAGQLRSETIGDVEYWFGEKHPTPRPAGIQLIQAYDEYIVGYADHSHLMHPDGTDAEPPQASGRHVILLDGGIAGQWRRTVAKGRVEIEAALDLTLTTKQASALKAAAGQHGTFLGAAPQLVTS